MHTHFQIHETSDIATPALAIFPEIVRSNVAQVIDLVGGAHRLRPHAKTHKTREITRMQLDAGVTKHKCATIAEAEMLASTGVPDVLLAYPAVGPTATRLARLSLLYPATKFSALVDSVTGVANLADAAKAHRTTLHFLVDVDVGQHRTGIAPEEVVELYQRAAKSGLQPDGLHAYDGHNNAESRDERMALARQTVSVVTKLRNQLTAAGLACPRIVVGGTPAFPCYATMMDIPDLECSPGTYVLHDHGYGSKFPDLAGVRPAAAVITRVVSKPGTNRITFDCGTKSIASDPPAGKRLIIVGDPTLVPVGHNEEHYIVESATPERWSIGNVTLAIPTHICPTVALHREALTVVDGKVVGRWTIAARDRMITV